MLSFLDTKLYSSTDCLSTVTSDNGALSNLRLFNYTYDPEGQQMFPFSSAVEYM